MANGYTYVTENLCQERRNDLRDMKKDIDTLNGRLDNHLLKMAEDITSIKTDMSYMKSAINKNNGYKGGFNDGDMIKLDRSLVYRSLGIFSLLVAIVFILVTKGEIPLSLILG